jgi:hypothetical protein
MRRWTTWLIALGGAVVLASCVLPPADIDDPVSTGGGSAQGGAGGGGSGGGGSGGSGGVDVCQDCLSTYCSSEAAACVQNPYCQAIVECGANCSDLQCYDDCYAQYPAGQAAYDDNYNCLDIVCSSECSGS